MDSVEKHRNGTIFVKSQLPDSGVYDWPLFFEELKKLSPLELNHIWGQRRQQNLKLAIIFNMTIQFFIALKNRGAREKLKIVKFLSVNFTFI